MKFNIESAASMLGSIQCGSGFRRDCMKGVKCKLWHIGEPTGKINDKRTYNTRGTVNHDKTMHVIPHTPEGPKTVVKGRRRTLTPAQRTKDSKKENKQYKA